MRRRILFTVMGVSIVAVAAFFIPAALAIRSRDAETQRLDVQREAAVAVAAVDPAHPGDTDLPIVEGHQYGLYDANGERFVGEGPAKGDAPVLAALAEGDALERVDDQLIATLLVDDHDGRGQPVVLRVAEPADEAAAATRRAVGGLALGAIAILATTWLVAYALTARLTRPIDTLRAAAGRLGSGDFATGVAPTGVAELDEVGTALGAAGERIGTAMARERAFSADASHQLRTPITAMRTAIETEQFAPRADHTTILGELLDQTDRLESIVVSLLALARETHHHRTPADLRAAVTGAVERWQGAVDAAGRILEVRRPDEPVWSTASPAAADHVLDVLVDNALGHGTGRITVDVAAVGSGCRITISDEGHLAEGIDLFARRAATATGTGIGLQLARSLAEAEGGRLRLTSTTPTTFELTLPGPADLPI